jgi:hypothetical protein
MDLSQLNETIKELPEKQKSAILKLIDIKTNEDMKEVIQSIKHLESKLESKITTVFWILGIIITLIVALKIFG